MRILALDLGSKRVGVAASDELGLMAHALPYIDVSVEETFFRNLALVLEDRKPEKVIVGFPRTMSGEVGIAAQNIERRVEDLKKRFPDAVFEFWDERLTTKAAEVYLRESGQSQTKRRARVDSLAAQILLQNYLDFKKTGDCPPGDCHP